MTVQVKVGQQRKASELAGQLTSERLASFVRLKGGFPIPLAGAVYWAGLGVAGYRLSPDQWNLLAFVASGMIFPLALLFSKLWRVDFMRDRTAVSSVLFPSFASMLLFWPIAISAMWKAPQLVPLVLAIGMSQHWPVIGWSYGKTAVFTTHSVVRAVGAFILWNWRPHGRFTVLPFWVSVVYLVTVVCIVAAAKHSAEVRL
jgi:hypothetical protein